MAASRLVRAHIEAERRLRVATTSGVERIWHALPDYNRANVDQWLSQVLPLVEGAQRRSVALTEAYLARAMGRRPFGLDPAQLIGAAVRNGVAPEEVYRRPFVTMWSSLGSGNLWQDAFNAGLARATGTAAVDVQLSNFRTAAAVGSVDPQIQRFQRVADDGACEFCNEVDGAILNSDDVAPLHNNCGCSVEPLTELRPLTPKPAGVHEHGELGPVLTDPADHFTTESQALA